MQIEVRDHEIHLPKSFKLIIYGDFFECFDHFLAEYTDSAFTIDRPFLCLRIRIARMVDKSREIPFFRCINQTITRRCHHIAMARFILGIFTATLFKFRHAYLQLNKIDICIDRY